MIVDTLEVRWFWRTARPDIAARLFTAVTGGFDADAVSRTDSYLLLPGCPTTGIKLREGRFEIKALVAPLDKYAVNQNLSGQVQKWIKWSVPRSESQQFAEDPDYWREIYKSRFLRYFTRENGELIEVSDDRMDSAGHIELTRVNVTDSGETWLTLGMEIPFAQDDSINMLYALIRQFFLRNQDFVSLMNNTESLSYPQWLHTFFNKGAD